MFQSNLLVYVDSVGLRFRARIVRELPRRDSDKYHMSPEQFVTERKTVDVETIPTLYSSRGEARAQGEQILNQKYLHFTVRN